MVAVPIPSCDLIAGSLGPQAAMVIPPRPKAMVTAVCHRRRPGPSMGKTGAVTWAELLMAAVHGGPAFVRL
jgi:hypothetical protein